uniref:Uncharacterized protein n=1 Tax=Trichobilharzia regenti TaxID=157069 RepID=A0AA85JXH9_TRIRE|nr:unnamed protein product [Trichobilharzia regenti]
MTATGKPRRESAKICLQAIDGITTQEDFDDSSISENIESEASDYVAESENNDVSTDDSDFSSENEADVSGDLKNPSSTSSPTGSVIEEPLPRPLSIKSRRSGLNDKTYLRSPFVRYMRACRGRIDRDPKSIAPVKFQQAIEALKFTFRNIPNPFLCCPSGHKPQFICRQNALFPTSGAWIRTPIHVKKDYLPEPYISPIYLSGQMNRIKLKRFEFDNDSNLVYVGGEVTCLSWCPPRLSSLLESDIIRDECSFLATASILTPDSHTLYSDDMKSGAGTIQIWNCGILGLTKVSSNLKPEIHFIITHDWGRVIDMCWVPVSPFSGIKELKAKACLHGSYMTTIREVERVLGHLIVACQDGFIRVLSIPTCPMNFGCENSAASAFTYTPTKYSYLTLSPSMSENPHWLGWPTCLHIRREFPDRLFAGYTTGYVCCYNLSSLNELVYSPKYNHLAPVKMSRLTNSPVTSISLHPLNGKMLFVQGLERIAGIWDLNDSVCFTSESGEITWKPVHGFMGREAMWISNGEFLVSSRETWFTSAICKTNQYPKWAALFDNMDNCICQFLPSEPNEGCSHLVPLGIQSLTSVDFSDALNAVICSTDRGRIEAVAESVEKRKCDPARPKYIPEMRIPICQWIINKRPPETIHQRIKPEEKYEEVTTVDNEQGDFNKYDYNIIDITSFFDENQFDCIPSTSFSSSPPPTPPPSLANFSITSVDYSNNTTVSAAAVAAPATSPEKMVVKKTDDNVCDGDDDDNVNDEELRQSIFPSPDCEHCELEQSICWHKLWANYELQIMLKSTDCQPHVQPFVITWLTTG